MIIDARAQLERYFTWDHWANRTMLDSLSTAAELPVRTRMIAAHILAAQQLWLARLKDEAPRVIAVWPEWSVEECDAHLGSLEHEWSVLLKTLHPEQLKERVAYSNSKGEHFQSAVGDILMHVVMHGAYHRGQVAADVRGAGGVPAYTDFIEAVRKGLVR